MADSPAIDARQLAALRKRTLAAARKAAQALEVLSASHRDALEAGNVPPAAEMRKLADKYLTLHGTLACIDSVLTPFPLSELPDWAEDAGTITVSRDDVDVLVQFCRGFVTEATGPVDGTPLGRLMHAAENGR